MTPGEMASIGILFTVYTFAMLIIGMVFGALFMASYITRQVERAQDEMVRKLFAPPKIVPDGEDWKQKSEDDKWLRDQIDGKDNDKGTK